MGRPSSPRSHPCHSLTQLFFFPSLSGSLISKRHTHTNTRMHFITHSFSVYSVQIAGVIAEMTSSQIILGSFPWTNTTNPHSLRLAASSHTTLPSSSPQFICDFSFTFSPSVTHSRTLILSVTSLSVNIAFLSAWQSEHKSSKCKHFDC